MGLLRRLAGGAPVPPGAGAGGDAATELLEQTKLLAEEERARVDTLNQRAGVVLGFSSAVVGLVATQAKDVLARAAELGQPGRELAAISLLAALAFVVLAALLCAWPVMRLRRAPLYGLKEIQSFATPDALARPVRWHQIRLQRALTARIERERVNNRTRARAVNAALVSLALAAVMFAVHAGVFLIDALNGPECSARGSGSSATARAQHDNEIPPCPDLDEEPVRMGRVFVLAQR